MHSAWDRDRYITVHWQNMDPKHQHNFYRFANEFDQVTYYNTTYDYDSLMHYPTNGFSINGWPTISPKVSARVMSLCSHFTATIYFCHLILCYISFSKGSIEIAYYWTSWVYESEGYIQTESNVWLHSSQRSPTKLNTGTTEILWNVFFFHRLKYNFVWYRCFLINIMLYAKCIVVPIFYRILYETGIFI